LGSAKSVKYLIDAGADVNIKQKDGYNALNFAIERHYTDSAKVLIDAGSELNHVVQDGTNRNAIIRATSNGLEDTVRHLVDAGADLNYIMNGSKTVLDVAIYEAFEDLAEYLHSNGAVCHSKTYPPERWVTPYRRKEGEY